MVALRGIFKRKDHILVKPAYVRPGQIAELLKPGKENRQIREHLVSVFRRVFEKTGNVELALFALCHQSTRKEVVEASSELGLSIRSYDFIHYDELRRMDITGTTYSAYADVYAEILMHTNPMIFLLRMYDIADVGSYTSDQRDAIYRGSESRLEAEAGLRKIAHMIKILYSHAAHYLGDQELFATLQDVRMSIEAPMVYDKCREFLDHKEGQLREIETAIREHIIPSDLEVRSRIKGAGSLADKLVIKAEEETGHPQAEEEVYRLFFKGPQWIRDKIKDLVGFEVSIDNGNEISHFVDTIKRNLARSSYEVDEVELKVVKKAQARKRIVGREGEIIDEYDWAHVPAHVFGKLKQDNDKDALYTVYIIAKAPEEKGGHKIEIQVQTKKTTERKKRSEFNHAQFKGSILGPSVLEKLRFLGEIVRLRMGVNEDEVRIYPTVVRDPHYGIMGVPFPETITLLDVVARSVGTHIIDEVIRQMASRTGSTPGSVRYSDPVPITDILRPLGSIFIVGGREEPNAWKKGSMRKKLLYVHPTTPEGIFAKATLTGRFST